MYCKLSLFVTGEKTVEYLNMALESADREKFYEILRTPCLEISHCIDEFAIPLYYQEMKEDHMESGVRSRTLSLCLIIFFRNKSCHFFKVF